ncbi:MAG TPA: hypothetical protein VFH37_01645 [Candidatus Saccharimonadales bacterium]|nr:hypothetical protein [Candidatus Saccharimonadales bacterium]
MQVSELKKLYRTDELPATGEFSNLLETLDEMSLQDKDELDHRHKFEHATALASYGVPPEAINDKTTELLSQLQSTDPDDQETIMQLEFQIISYINQAKDKQKKAA